MATSTVLLLSEANVAQVLGKIAPSDILACVGRSMYTFSHASDAASSKPEETPTIQNPLRINVLTPAHNVLFMPSRLGSEETTSIKVVSVPRRSNDKTGLPATTLVFDESNGQTRAVVNARALTAVRTAAASALAVKLSPRASEAKSLLICGTGAQALWHAKLISDLSAYLEEVTLASRAVNERSQALHTELECYFKALGRTVRILSLSITEATSAGGIIERADLVSCCTPAIEPLFDGSRLKAGCSLTLIGSYKPNMQEVDLVPLFSSTSPRATRILVDSESACLAEAGELYKLRDKRPELFETGQTQAVLVELGTLLDEGGEALTEGLECDDINIFKCVGMGVMDSAITALIVKKAEELGIGSNVPF